MVAEQAAGQEDADPDDVPPPTIPLSTAQHMAEQLFMFMGDQGSHFTERELGHMRLLRDRVARMHAANASRTRQTTLDAFWGQEGT